MTPTIAKTNLYLFMGCLIVASLLGMSGASAARAATTYETVDRFAGILTPPAEGANWPEDVQLGGVSGMAINRTGAGGVPKGTLFAAVPASPGGDGEPSVSPGVARYAPDGTFEETFTEESTLCGPIAPGSPACTPRANVVKGALDVDIDQSTGNIYFFNFGRANGNDGLRPTIMVFSPDGSEVLTEFGVAGKFGETATEGPDRIHDSSVGGIAVNNDGEVYVFDEDNPSDFYKRLIVFKPETPGDYEHYVYAGKAAEVGGTFGTISPRAPVLDDAGDVYVGGDGYIAKYDLSVSRVEPACLYTVKSGITAFTVNPATGEVFYYSSADRKMHLLNPCNSAGKFTETEPAFKPTPERDNLWALAFNPERQFESFSPAGVLYGGAPNGKNEGGIGGDAAQSSLGYIFARPASFTPVVESESVTNVRTTSATLRAMINPKGSLTSYAFQYIDQASWEANETSERFAGALEIPLGGTTLGSGQIPLPATAPVSGLAPGSDYHYRVVATSEQGTTQGLDQGFRTFPVEAAGLPDGRAYERVSPAQKYGGEPLPSRPAVGSCAVFCKPGLQTPKLFPVQVSPDGDSIAYMSQPFRLNTGPTEFDQNVARRTAGGWRSTGIGPPTARGGQPYASFALDPDLEKAVLYVNNPSLAPEAPLDYENLLTQPTGDPLSLEPLLKAVPPGREAGGPDRFEIEYAGASADLSRIFFAANAALTGPTAVAPAAVDGGGGDDGLRNLYEWFAGELRLVNVAPGNAATAPGADFGGLKAGPNDVPVLVHAVSTDGTRVFWRDAGGHLYVRENGETTREIPVSGQFLSASPDGSEVLLSSGNLYDLDTETTTDLTAGKGGFLGLAGQSDDLSRLYFVSTSVLDESPNSQGAVAEEGMNNLYAWEGGSARFIAVLDAQDGDPEGIGDWAPSPTQRTAQASPDGSALAFQSLAPLTGEDNDGLCALPLAPSDKLGSCNEVFVYDGDDESLVCASCNPVGALALGHSFLPILNENSRGGYLRQPRYVANSGRVFFDSRDSLSQYDTNNGVEDVYQYEPKGIGSCGREGGCVALISAGREPIDSNFLDADETGRNVFFTSRDQLVLSDKDDLIDLYVAREGGGFPGENQVTRSECQGEACQPPYSPPSDPTPASLNFQGAGNVGEEKPHRKHKKHPKRHKKQNHAKKHKGGKHNRGGAK